MTKLPTVRTPLGLYPVNAICGAPPTQFYCEDCETYTTAPERASVVGDHPGHRVLNFCKHHGFEEGASLAILKGDKLTKEEELEEARIRS